MPQDSLHFRPELRKIGEFVHVKVGQGIGVGIKVRVLALPFRVSFEVFFQRTLFLMLDPRASYFPDFHALS